MRFHQLEEELRRDKSLVAGESWSATLSWLVAAQKFYVGDVSLLPETISTVGRFPRLPFKISAFELAIRDDLGRDHPLIALAWSAEGDATSTLLFFAKLHGWLRIGYGQVDHHTTRVSWGLFHDDPPIIVPKLVQGGLRECGNFLEVLNCSNVAVEDVTPSKALNRKRADSGKSPVYTYKILVLRRDQRRAAALHGCLGTKNSPRIHVRRGHIKRRKTGNFWWQPHLVGDPDLGGVGKDYHAGKLVESLATGKP